MGQVMGSLTSRKLGLEPNRPPEFGPMVGFTYKRLPRKMDREVKEEELVSARIPPKYRDYCADYLLDYQVCRHINFPLVYKCHCEKHNYLNCEQQDYVIRMKEFERERRLRCRENRLKECN
ncbi:NADH dehydrogenase [ubiquinone] 1 beta subcomplex subunit 7-like [Cydia fagiglandana]|uniref:NADH dehydrogenase [ubiquinone] 1 beta subcomplex subunit 7-like n=1 Tax=Cydia fagiglandana TaxID=1458189 RepID=UPI002FEE5F93